MYNCKNNCENYLTVNIDNELLFKLNAKRSSFHLWRKYASVVVANVKLHALDAIWYVLIHAESVLAQEQSIGHVPEVDIYKTVEVVLEWQLSTHG